MSTGPRSVTSNEIGPDHSRTVLRFFVPGREDVGPGDSRALPVIKRILAMTERDVKSELARLEAHAAGDARDLFATFRTHAELLASRITSKRPLSDDRRTLLGAAFTHEYAIEGAALCNPSIVEFSATSDGTSNATSNNASTDSCSFVMSLRGIGEGHISSIGFRTGSVDLDRSVHIDAPSADPRLGSYAAGTHRRAVLEAHLLERGETVEGARELVSVLPERFSDDELERRLIELSDQAATRRHVEETIAHLRESGKHAYLVEFSEASDLSERVLWPHTSAERQGLEDARFCRFVRDDDTVTYYATYTAFDGGNIAQHLLETDDFRIFHSGPMAGDAARGKGLALFPRPIGGRFYALSRADRETNALAASDDMSCWNKSQVLQVPTQPWEVLQIGNCGSPLETPEGWLVLTHGVGVFRTYAIGAILLDLDDPTKVLARSVEPLVRPTGRVGGYVPNVVYSCGGLITGDTLVLPYGVCDQSIAIDTFSVREVIDGLR